MLRTAVVLAGNRSDAGTVGSIEIQGDTMTNQSPYVETTTKAQDMLAGAVEGWAQGVQRLFAQTPPAAQNAIDPAVVAAWYFDSLGRFTGQLVELNRRYVKNVADAIVSMQDAAREQAESLTSAVREHVNSLSGIARAQADRVEQASREEADAAERETRREARQARREARGAAEDKSSDLTKPELQEALAQRGLHKTGNVDELRARLVDAELAGASVWTSRWASRATATSLAAMRGRAGQDVHPRWGHSTSSGCHRRRRDGRRGCSAPSSADVSVTLGFWRRR